MGHAGTRLSSRFGARIPATAPSTEDLLNPWTCGDHHIRSPAVRHRGDHGSGAPPGVLLRLGVARAARPSAIRRKAVLARERHLPGAGAWRAGLMVDGNPLARFHRYGRFYSGYRAWQMAEGPRDNRVLWAVRGRLCIHAYRPAPARRTLTWLIGRCECPPELLPLQCLPVPAALVRRRHVRALCEIEQRGGGRGGG